MNEPALSPRLSQIARWVPPGQSFADVGTDHALLPVWLRLRGIVPRAVASDLRPGPLARARETGRRFGADGIDYRLCPGLRDILPHEAQTLTIAGMGGETIVSILRQAPWVNTAVHTLLLQPQTHEETVRQYLSENGFAITQEAAVLDRGLYIVIRARPGRQILTPDRLWAGAALADTPLTHRYRREKLRRLEHALAGLLRARQKDEVRIAALQEAVAALRQAKEAQDHAHRT